MKKGVKILVIALIAVIVIILGIIGGLFLLIDVDITLKPHKEDTTTEATEQITDEDILDFLKGEGVVGSDDVYINYDRDIGLFGPEGYKRYIYRRADGSHYYIRIVDHQYYGNGEYAGYEYTAGEVFYTLTVQDCTYNINSESMDERISDTIGEAIRYVVSGDRHSLTLSTAE